MKISVVTSVCLALILAASASTAARAESTTMTTTSYTVVTDAHGQIVPGLAGTFCYTAFFKSGGSDRVCRDRLSTDNGGAINFTGIAKSWRGEDDVSSYAVTFEVNGAIYTGSVSTFEIRTQTGGDLTVVQKTALWPASCTDVGVGYSFGCSAGERPGSDGLCHIYYDSACSQAVHFEVKLPLTKQCATHNQAGINQISCALAFANGLGAGDGADELATEQETLAPKAWTPADSSGSREEAADLSVNRAI